jgi:hypothetical protein
MEDVQSRGPKTTAPRQRCFVAVRHSQPPLGGWLGGRPDSC